MPKAAQTIACTVRQLLFSPKGHIEGFLAIQDRKRIQVRVPPHIGQQLAQQSIVGRKVHVHGRPDDSPKAKKAAHPVYELEFFADREGNEATPFGRQRAPVATLKGKVAQLHFAKHGEANGVMLASGEFIHLRPHGMAAAELKIGSRVEASGPVKTTVLGSVLMEAATVNGIEIE